MKKVLLLATLGLSFGLMTTSCSKDNGHNKQPKVVYTMMNPTNKAELDKIKTEFASIKAEEYDKVSLAASTKPIFKTWAKEYKDVKALTTMAEKGNAGYLPDGKKKRYVTAKAVEPNQLMAKGAIGAFQLKHFNACVIEGMGAKTAKGRAEALNKAVVYLLGDLKFGKTKDEFIAVGNSFVKYLMSISTKEGGKYFGIAKQLEAEVTKAYTTVATGEGYTMSLAKIGTLANTVVAFRGVHYLAKYAEKIRQEGGMTGHNVHELSEGLGFIYSLQFAYNYTKHRVFYLTAEEANAVANANLWEEAQDKSGASLLDKMAEKVAKDFGFTLAEAKA